MAYRAVVRRLRNRPVYIHNRIMFHTGTRIGDPFMQDGNKTLHFWMQDHYYRVVRDTFEVPQP